MAGQNRGNEHSAGTAQTSTGQQRTSVIDKRFLDFVNRSATSSDPKPGDVTSFQNSQLDSSNSDDSYYDFATDRIVSRSNTETNGILLVRHTKLDSGTRHAGAASLTPRNLQKGQKEWLLETRWAQDAFLSSYMLAISDNPGTFNKVQSLTLSRFSSRHLPKLSRLEFWAALPTLATFTLEVIADWRDIEKDPTGCAEDTLIEPSAAGASLYALLRERIASKQSIKTISFGWADGGEHAEGLHARNRNVLPAPIIDKDSTFSQSSDFANLLTLPHVDRLTLVNCWLTPNALRAFVSAHRAENLKHITLESVSLTTHPKFNRQDVNNPGHALNPGGPNLHPLAMGNNALGGNQAQAGAAQQLMAFVPLLQQQHQHHLQYIQQAQVHLQIQQLQQHMQQLLQMQQQQLPTHQTPAGNREGSWPDALTNISADYVTSGNFALSLDFISCGYVHLRNAPFDQSVLENAALEQEDPSQLLFRRTLTTFLESRLTSMGCSMMTSHDRLLATIVTALPPGEMDTLQTEWGLSAGWPAADELADVYADDDGWGKWGWRNRVAAEYDAARAGGTGRFSGRITGFVDPDEEN